MADPRMEYDPVDGWNDGNTFPDNPDDVQVRGLFQRLHDQTRDFLNNTLIAWINTTFATKTDNNLKANTTDVYTRTQLNNGQLNTIYYTKPELNPFIQGGGTKQKEQAFTIVTSDNGDGTFTYKDKDNNQFTGTLSQTGGQIFELTQGEYILGDNRVEAIVNDTLRRSVASGGLIETDTTHVELTSPEGNGAEITIKYMVALNLASNAGLVTVTNGVPSSPYTNQIIIDTSI